MNSSNTKEFWPINAAPEFKQIFGILPNKMINAMEFNPYVNLGGGMQVEAAAKGSGWSDLVDRVAPAASWQI